MRVVVSAGGTGGHIYPAVSIINKIREKESNSEFLYIGTTDRMEKDLIPQLGINYQGIEISGLKRKLTLKNFDTINKFLKARKTCKKLIKDFNPDVVIGTGGYVTAPVVWASHKLGIKTFIHEQNSVVGLSNKYLTRYVDKVGVSFESTMKEFPKDKVILTGNPCGESAISMKKANKMDYQLTPSKKLVLIVMGSLGSKTINEKIVSFINNFKEKDYEVMFITGKTYYEEVKNIKLPSNVKIAPFINGMPSLMKTADLIITRAGASTMSEIIALELPAIFVPSPFVTNNHQYKNANDLATKNAGIILEEQHFNWENLNKQINYVLLNKEKYQEIKNNLKKLAVTDSSERIYNILKEMITHDKKHI